VTEEKIRENRLRRAADRRGWQLRKSRRRDPWARDYGRYWLIDVDTNSVVAGDTDGCTLDQIEEYLPKSAP
jgi:hypothetical protein